MNFRCCPKKDNHLDEKRQKQFLWSSIMSIKSWEESGLLDLFRQQRTTCWVHLESKGNLHFFLNGEFYSQDVCFFSEIFERQRIWVGILVCLVSLPMGFGSIHFVPFWWLNLAQAWVRFELKDAWQQCNQWTFMTGDSEKTWYSREQTHSLPPTPTLRCFFGGIFVNKTY